tara:strand:- start:126 stop:608 length:483 start_codon:yes stop_codon:yes gene_type:complete
MAITFHPDGTVTGGFKAPGAIIQTIKKELTTSPSTTSTSYQEVTGLSQAITLSNANNKVLVTVVCQVQGYGDQDRRIDVQVYHTSVSDSNRFTKQEFGEYKSGSSSSYSFGNVTHIILDTPGSTSRTYKVAYRSIDGSTVGVQGSSSYTRSYILLQEIVT